MEITEYLSTIREKFESGQATEHSYRPAMEKLFQSILPTTQVINEPRRLVGIGAPDFVFARKGIPVGWCEHKDLKPGLDIRNLDGFNFEQKQRYSEGLSNLIYTNGIEFELITDGVATDYIAIARLTPQQRIEAIPENFKRLFDALRDFVERQPQSITSATELAERMSRKAVLIRGVLAMVLQDDEQRGHSSALYSQYQAFEKNLIQDISSADFADLYAETLAYGLFAARLNAVDAHQFSRTTMIQAMQRSNPFLHELFGFIAGASLEQRIALIIEDLCTLYRAADLSLILQDFGKSTAQEDPFIHFYETFLAAYDPDKRKARGVWYTPEPVVNFIVRAVDDILKSEFALSDGLADISKLTLDWNEGTAAKPKIMKRTVHRVQILDPSTGTGTFLIEVVKLVSERVQQLAPALWSHYVEQELIPRLHGFELLMASYAVCFMKLELMLKQLHYQPSAKPPRYSVYLTNSLQEGQPTQITIPFAQWLANEANQANAIKSQTPIMCVIGNPPYRGESVNHGSWISALMNDYKKEPGGKIPLNERNPKWINDDYVKFIRYAVHMIDKNGEGVLGFITNSSYLDNPTFRGMRWHLLSNFDEVNILDLHGNSRKQELSPDGAADQNVFDIQQGVAIIIAFRKKHKLISKNRGLATVRYGELWGSRKTKFISLLQGDRASLIHTPIVLRNPDYAFVPRNMAGVEDYERGFSVKEFMPDNNVGIVTCRDRLTIATNPHELWDRINDFVNLDAEVLRDKYQLPADVRDWKISYAKTDVIDNLSFDNIVRISYRPFDNRWTYYTAHSRGFLCYPRDEIMRHFLGHDNLGLSLTRQQKGTNGFHHCFVHSMISESSLVSNKTSEIGSSFPLYLYPQNGNGELTDHAVRLNFDPAIYAKICAAAGLGGKFIPPQGDDFRTKTGTARPDEVKVFDYIYGYLHDRHYRQNYAEFLKLDFPRIPYPTDAAEFMHYSRFGEQLRRLHLMEESAIGSLTNPFRGETGGKVSRMDYRHNRIYINSDQYFDLVAPEVWEFTIGGYQPAQKWLKDRKGLVLSFEEVRHYQKILQILEETDRLMDELSPGPER